MNSAKHKNAIDFTRKWHVLTAVGSGVFLATVDSSIINVSLPTLVESLKTEFSIVQWVVLAYLLTVTTTMLSFGRLADMIGKKRIYMAGFIIFTTGSVLCGLSETVYWLIFFRIIQALGAAMIMALGAAIVTEAFPPEERGKAMGTIGVIVSLGIIMGPTLGGLIISSLSWRWIFYVNLPVGVIGTFMVIKNVPDFKPTGKQQFDYFGALTSFLSLFLFLMGLTFGQRNGFSTLSVTGMLSISALLLIIFIIIEKKTPSPMIDLSIFKNGLFSTNLTTGFLSFVSLGGVLILMPFYLENILHLKTIHVGLLMGVIPVMLGIMSPIAGALSDRLGTRALTFAGLLILLIGYLMASTLKQDTSPMGYIIRMLALGIGMGIFISPNNSAIMGVAHRRHLGIISGMMAITRTLGQTMGVAVMGAVWAGRTAHYSGSTLERGASFAPVNAQINGLHDMLLSSALLLFIALTLSAFTFLPKNRVRQDNLTSDRSI